MEIVEVCLDKQELDPVYNDAYKLEKKKVFELSYNHMTIDSWSEVNALCWKASGWSTEEASEHGALQFVAEFVQEH